jgi:hypothetical protein
MPSLFRFSLVALLLFSLTSCVSSRGRNSGDDDDSSDDDDASPDDDDASNDPLMVRLSDLDFTHVFGVDGCPQLIGTLELVNNTDDEATYEIAAAHELLDVRDADDGDVAGGTLAGGDSLTLDVVSTAAAASPTASAGR